MKQSDPITWQVTAEWHEEPQSSIFAGPPTLVLSAGFSSSPHSVIRVVNREANACA